MKKVWVLNTDTVDGLSAYTYATETLGRQAYIDMVNDFYNTRDDSRYGPDVADFEAAKEKAENAVNHGSGDYVYLEECEVEGSEEKEYTGSEQIALGKTIAAIFRLKVLKHDGEKGRYMLGGGYLTKTPLGLFRVFMDIADQIRAGKEIKA